MKQQIIVSGIGGQGVLFLTRVLAEAAMEMGLDVLTSETHGMAMRGGTVISHIKVGGFKSPLIRRGQADVGLFLYEINLQVHRDLVKESGRIFLNTPNTGEGNSIDAARLARTGGSLVVTNLVLLGYAVREKALFCDAAEVEAVIRRISPPLQVEMNMKGLQSGLSPI